MLSFWFSRSLLKLSRGRLQGAWGEASAAYGAQPAMGMGVGMGMNMGMGGGFGVGGMPVAAQQQVMRVSIPENVVGRIIGKGGQTINEIRQKSQANIRIDNEGFSGLRVVTITGTPQGIKLHSMNFRKDDGSTAAVTDAAAAAAVSAVAVALRDLRDFQKQLHVPGLRRRNRAHKLIMRVIQIIQYFLSFFLSFFFSHVPMFKREPLDSAHVRGRLGDVSYPAQRFVLCICGDTKVSHL